MAIDEAVRLVRRYASDEGGGLVNGILGAVLLRCSARAVARQAQDEPERRRSERGGGRWRKSADDSAARVHEIAGQLRELEERLRQASSADVEMSLLERATELAEEAARLLEQVGARPTTP